METPAGKKGKIDLEVLRNRAVRADVRKAWEAAHARFPTSEHGHAPVWEYFKKQVHAMLVGASLDMRERREGKPGEVRMLKEQIAAVAEAARTDDPSERRSRRLQDLHEKLKEAVKKGRPARGASAWAKVMREEVSSRLFWLRSL